MRKDGEVTRTKIMDATNALFLDYGYSGTTLDDILEKTGITKGAFFYHFKSKEDLARALVERYAEHDRIQLDELLQRAEKLSGDPAHQLILLIGLYIDFLEGADQMPDGCLYATYCYESGLLEAGTLKPVKEMVLYWRATLAEKIQQALRQHKPRIPVDPEILADQALVVFEGAYVLARTTGDKKIMIQQLDQLRNYLALIFQKEKELSAIQ